MQNILQLYINEKYLCMWVFFVIIFFSILNYRLNRSNFKFLSQFNNTANTWNNTANVWSSHIFEYKINELIFDLDLLYKDFLLDPAAPIRSNNAAGCWLRNSGMFEVEERSRGGGKWSSTSLSFSSELREEVLKDNQYFGYHKYNLGGPK